MNLSSYQRHVNRIIDAFTMSNYQINAQVFAPLVSGVLEFCLGPVEGCSGALINWRLLLVVIGSVPSALIIGESPSFDFFFFKIFFFFSESESDEDVPESDEYDSDEEDHERVLCCFFFASFFLGLRFRIFFGSPIISYTVTIWKELIATSINS